MQKFGSVCDLFNVKRKMNKTIMNMIRLYLMVFDILEKGEIITNRAAAHELLMEARSGGFQNENGYISHELKNLQKEYEKRLQYDRANTMLPRAGQYETNRRVSYDYQRDGSKGCVNTSLL